MHECLLGQLGDQDMVATRAAIILDAALFAFDSRRNGKRVDATALVDARPKEAHRRHSQARAVVIQPR